MTSNLASRCSSTFRTGYEQGPATLQCSLEAGHDGEHVARDDAGRVIDSWEDDEAEK